LRDALADLTPRSPPAGMDSGLRWGLGRHDSVPDNVRRNIVAPGVKRANELLTGQGAPTIAHCTPHSLRRAFASLLAELGVPLRRAMYLLGQAPVGAVQKASFGH
jgi:integrase